VAVKSTKKINFN